MPRQGLLHISENRRFGVQEKRMSDGKITIKSESQRALMRAAGERAGFLRRLASNGIEFGPSAFDDSTARMSA